MMNPTRLNLVITGLVCLWGWATSAVGQIATTNLLTNPGAESGDLTGWSVGGDSKPFVGNPTNSLGDGFATHSGNYYFVGGTGGVGVGGTNGWLSQIVPLVGNQGITTADLDGGQLAATVSLWQQGLNQGTPSDNSNVGLTFLDATSNILGQVYTPILDSHNGAWQGFTNQYALPSGTRWLQYTIYFYRHAGTDLDSFIDDNSLTIGESLLPPTLFISRAATNALISWMPNTPGFVLQAADNLSPPNWGNSPSGSTNPVSVLTTGPARFYRLYKP